MKWVPEISSLTVRIGYTGIDGVKERHVHCTVQAACSSPQSFHGYSFSNEKNIVHPSLPCYQPCRRCCWLHDHRSRKRDTLRDSIAQLLDSCGTPRQVLEVLHWTLCPMRSGEAR